MAKKYQSGSTREQIVRKYNTGAPDPHPWEEPGDYLKRLGKMADTRMRRLEKLALEPGYENVLKWAYAAAKKDLMRMDANNFESVAKRTKAGDFDKRNLQMRINAVKRFLESPTSMKSTIDKQYAGTANNINNKYGTDFKWQDIGKFFDSEAWKKISDQYGSKTALRAIGTIRRMDLNNIDDVNKAIKEASESTQYLKDDEVNAVIKKLLRKNGVNKRAAMTLKEM